MSVQMSQLSSWFVFFVFWRPFEFCSYHVFTRCDIYLESICPKHSPTQTPNACIVSFSTFAQEAIVTIDVCMFVHEQLLGHNSTPIVARNPLQCVWIFLYIKFKGHVRLNSHGRHVSVYFAVYPTLLLAFRVADVGCKLQLAARPNGRQPAVD